MDFKRIEETVRGKVPVEYQAWLGEFEKFLRRLWREVRDRSGRFRLGLIINGDTEVAERARLNAYIAYLVHMGYINTTEALRHVAGGESLYTWLRFYRQVNGAHAQSRILELLLKNVPRDYWEYIPGFLAVLDELLVRRPFRRLLWPGPTYTRALVNAYYAFLVCRRVVRVRELVARGLYGGNIHRWVRKLRDAGVCG